VGPHGEVAVAWQSTDSGEGPNSILMDVDTDGLGNAASFGADRVVASTNVGGWDYIPAQIDRSIDAEPKLAFDRSGGATNGRLYLVYLDEVIDESNDTDVELKYSDNMGGSWTAAKRVNDDATKNSQFLPMLAVDQTTGNVGVSWLDCRNSPTNTGAELYVAVSFDHGGTFSPNVRISAGTSYQAGADPSLNDLDFGDNGGLAFAGGKLVPVWSDNSNSTGDNPDGTGRTFDVFSDIVLVG
jgi:hypothetical protein